MTHYSYSFYRDPKHAHQYEDDRFGGPIGRWLLDLETAAYLELLKPAPGDRILDVGTGTGKLVAPLVAAGAQVVATDASAAMLAHAAQKVPAAEAKGSSAFAVMDGHKLAFADRTFDCVVSSRVLMHVVEPKDFIAELCRVSRSRVAVDFPPKSSSNLLLPLLLPLKRRVDPNTHPYRVFSVREVTQLFDDQGFDVQLQHRQLFLPHFVHRKLGRPGLSGRIESLLRRGGLTRALGAPVLMVAARR